jgi:anti-sigma factor RsiW
VNQIACASGVELLMDFLDGVLPAEVKAALEQHVAGCPRCAAFVASYQAAPRILRDATAVALPPEVETSLKAFLSARTTAFKKPSQPS